MNKTKIPYLDCCWNITKGCSPISAGCEQCYANKMSKRLAGNNIRGYDKTNPFKPTFCHWAINEPLERKKPAVIGVSFMGDLFHEDITDEQIWKIFTVMFDAHWHKFVLCTKRPERVVKVLKQHKNIIGTHFLSHIWFGCSIEDNLTLGIRLPWMQQIKSLELTTWLSIEPLLEDISFDLNLRTLSDYADLFIVGGESGPGARFCDPEWIMNILKIVGPKGYFKQWGTHKEIYPELHYYDDVEQFNQLPWRINK